MQRLNLFLVCSVVLGLCWEAKAQETGAVPSESQPTMSFPVPNGPAVYALGLLSYRYSGTGLGAAGYYQHPIVPEGFLGSVERIQDVLGIEGGVALRFHSWGNGSNEWTQNEIAISGAAVWNLWFSSEFAAFAKLGFGFAFGSIDNNFNNLNNSFSTSASFSGLYGLSAVGVLYNLGALNLRAEISNLSLGLGAGLTF